MLNAYLPIYSSISGSRFRQGRARENLGTFRKKSKNLVSGVSGPTVLAQRAWGFPGPWSRREEGRDKTSGPAKPGSIFGFPSRTVARVFFHTCG